MGNSFWHHWHFEMMRSYETVFRFENFRSCRFVWDEQSNYKIRLASPFYHRQSYQGWCCYITGDFTTAALQNGVCITQQLCRIMISFYDWSTIKDDCSSPTPFTPILPWANVSFSQPYCGLLVELTDGRGGREWARSQIILPRESLVLYKSFITLWPMRIHALAVAVAGRIWEAAGEALLNSIEKISLNWKTYIKKSIPV